MVLRANSSETFMLLLADEVKEMLTSAVALLIVLARPGYFCTPDGTKASRCVYRGTQHGLPVEERQLLKFRDPARLG